ncbi:MAG: DUF1343 domain-containing protein [Spirochaetes bacterium]|nr:DUF1343 domain-containing protein [Spirochaetota bacterium]
MASNLLIRSFAFVLLAAISSCSGSRGYHLNSNGPKVKTGLEVFIKKYARDYKGKRAVLVTNHSGVNYNLESNIGLLRSCGIDVAMIMAPEHGLYGYENKYDPSQFYFESRVKTVVYNLHKLSAGDVRYLTKKADIVIFDIQDMGMRCYTYITNLKFIMDCLNGSGIELIVLDRPNPASFLGVDGAFLEKRFTTRFISAFPSTFLYDMTVGESAEYYRGEYAKEVKLRVIRMKGYDRDMMYTESALPWVPPSPNLPTYESSILYTSMVLMEGINISLGRGTPKPFEYIGAPWIEPVSFCRGLEELGLKNFRFRPVYFLPTFSKHSSTRCGGAQIFYLGGKFSPTEVSFRIIKYIMKTYPPARWDSFGGSYEIDSLAGTDRLRKAVISGKDYSEFRKEIEKESSLFNKKRKKYLIY